MIHTPLKSHSLATLLELLAENTKQVLDYTICRIDANIIEDKKKVVGLIEKAIVAKRAEFLPLK
jgi:hypothetical protein